MSRLRRLISALRPQAVRPPEPQGDAERVAEVEAVLAEMRPAIRADGGDVYLLAVEEGELVRLRLEGACKKCHAQDMTLRGMLEPKLREALPWVQHVRLE